MPNLLLVAVVTALVFFLVDNTIVRIAVVLFGAVTAAIPFVTEAVKPDPKKAEEGEKWLAQKAQEDGIYSLPSGMLVRILEKGTGEKSPKAGTPCDVHYEGCLTSGRVFDSSIRRGQPATFAPNQVIPGWTEALQMMREGDHWEVFIPYNLAYGARGMPPTIPQYAPLVFKMRLVKVKGGKAATEADAEIVAKLGKPYSEL